MNLSEFSVKNSLLVNSLSIFLVVAGLLALFRIEREAFPNFSFDIVVVSTAYRGAPPEVIEKRITIPLEKELKEVSDIKKMYSISVEGLSEVVLELDPDAPDKDRIYNDIQKAVDDADDLPEDLEDDPKVIELQTKDTPLVIVSLSGDMPEMELRELALRLETEILDLSEVSKVQREGLRDREIWVELDPAKMATHWISLTQVTEALSARNVNVAGGLQKGRERELILRTSGELENADDVRRVILRANEEGHWVRVGDIAAVSDGFEEERFIERTDGSRAINLMVVKKDRADAIRLMKDLQTVLDDFKSRNRPELKIALVDDISYYIKRRLNVLISNGWIGLLFVIIPMVIFLSWRVALGALMGIAVALLSAIAAMNFLGISINLISMFGLIMVLGMLVDEDLVVADNISRYLEEGKAHVEAAIAGSSEVGRAIISTVLTTIIAFIPLLFMSGIFGKFVSDIPKVVIITLTASLLEALVILPSHLSDLSRPKKEGQKSSFEKKVQHHYFDRFRDLYVRSLRYSLKHPIWTTVLSFGVIALAVLYAVLGLKFVLFPAKGIEAFFIRAQAPIGTSLERMEEKMQVLERLAMVLLKNELDHVVTDVGVVQNDPSDPFTERGSHVGQVVVYLTPETKRDREAGEIMEALRAKLPPSVSEWGFERVSFDPIKPGPPVGKPVAVRIRGDELKELDALAEDFKAELAKFPGVEDIRDDYERGKGELNIVVDEERASQAGLNYQDIAMTVRQAFQGLKATTIRKTDDEIDVVVRLPEEKRHDPGEIESLLIENKMGNLVRLADVARLEEGPGVSEIKHFDRKRVVTVTANVDEEVITSREVNTLLKKKFGTASKDHPGIAFAYGGEDEDTQESMRSLFRALAGAMFLIFIVLLVTFESMLQTFIIMLAIPFGLVGVVIGFALAGEPIGFLAFLGIIGMTGVVVDGGTLVFVFINRIKREGIPIKDAILAGCGVRLRSILLTTLTTVLGIVPAAYGIGGSDPFIQPMALALNWSIGVSIFFTLYTVPSLYYLADKATVRMRKLLPWNGEERS
ncbi:MAG TPA: efflux RND transporter permease subunit [bacterium]|nr:efflux RND transporter permease subunit [bacterium]